MPAKHRLVSPPRPTRAPRSVARRASTGLRRPNWIAFLALFVLSACTGGRPPEHAGAVGAPSAAEARTFFDRYASLLVRADPALIALYADDAKITAVAHEGNSTRNIDLTGKMYKEALASLLPALRASGDEITFTNIAFEPHDQLMRVTAHRYSTLHCWYDASYHADLGRKGGGTLRIVEEVSNTSSDSHCGLGPDKTLDQRLDELAGQVARALPVRIDPDTRLDAVRRGQTELRYELTLVGLVDIGAIDLAKLSTVIRQRVLQDTCKRRSALRAVLDDGGRVSYRYADLSGQALLSVTVDAASCPSG